MPPSGIGCSKCNIPYLKKDSATMSFRCRILCTFIAEFSVFSLPFILHFIMLQRNETKQKRTEYNGDRKSEKNTYKVVFQMFNRLFIPYRVCGTPVHSITCNRYPVLGGGPYTSCLHPSRYIVFLFEWIHLTLQKHQEQLPDRSDPLPSRRSHNCRKKTRRSYRCAVFCKIPGRSYVPVSTLFHKACSFKSLSFTPSPNKYSLSISVGVTFHCIASNSTDRSMISVK